MAFTLLDCPWPGCQSPRMTFRIHWHGPAPKPYLRWLGAVCQRCDAPVLLLVEFSVPDTRFDVINEGGDLSRWNGVVRASYPAPRATAAPDHTPTKVANLFGQAARSLNSGSWDAAGMTARRTLELATHDLDSAGELRSLTLKKRIARLAERGVITPALREWADAIREDGNDATHEPEPFDETAARRIVDFAETFLEQVYSMPGRLADRKKATDPKG